MIDQHDHYFSTLLSEQEDMTIVYGIMIIFGAVFAMYLRTLVHLLGTRGLFLWVVAVFFLFFGCSRI